MRISMKILVVFFLLHSVATSLVAQSIFFTDANKGVIVNGKSYRTIVGGTYEITSLKAEEFKAFLWSLPKEQNLIGRDSAPILALPMPDGRMAAFRVWESPVMEPGLANKFPGIKTFAGQGIDDPYATVRFDYNPSFGFSAQILSVNGDVYIDPFERGNTAQCISYYTKDNGRQVSLNCKTTIAAAERTAENAERGYCRGAQLYTFRLAISCTGEYATAVCAPAAPTVPATMAAIVTTINRVNGVYEKELAMRFLLVANNEMIVFTNSATDPFTNNNEDLLVNENQVATDNVIGFANYDVGQVFSTGNNSKATLYAVCNQVNKAKNACGLLNPTGDMYDIGRVAHNLGHSFGAIDSHNSNDVSCTGGGASAGFEPGSGTTIMSVAGTCGPDNIQPMPAPYFHSLSFNSITEFLQTSPVPACRNIINTGNNPPRIIALFGSGSYIPINTPFTLNATATDDDGDAITYSWEEKDNGISGAWNTGATSLTRPLFKSRVPKTTALRTFPDMAVILAGYPSNPPALQDGLKGETLPAVTRTMLFGLTIRDNRAGGGGVMNDENNCSSTILPYEVYSVATAGPFKVILPDGGENWSSNSQQTIIWNVAGTDLVPINTAFVNILLSTDGGLTYPFTLATNLANNGFAVVTMPNLTTSIARVKVEAVGNIYFDISNSNFSISASPTGFEFTAPALQTVACPGPSSVQYSLGTISNGGYTTAVALNATGVPAGATISFGTNPVVPGNTSLVTLNNINLVPNGLYYITVTGISGSINRSRVLALKVQNGAAPAITVQPVSQTDCEGGSVTFNVVSPSAISNQWQLSTDGGFTFSNISPGGNSSSLTVSNIGSVHFNYRYRCIVSGLCASTISAVVQVNVIVAPFISTQPQNVSVCAGGSRTINIAVSGSLPTYQWQLNSNGGAGFVNIAGAVSNILSLTNANIAMNNYQYRCLVLNAGCITPTVSNIATLTVNQLPTVTISAAPYTKLLPGLQTIITATGAAAPGSIPFTFRWTLDGAILGGISGNSYTAGITRLGNYRVDITDAKGCVNQSNILNIGDSVSTKLFIFPNPAKTSVELAFYNPGGQAVDWQITIYNSAGARVLFDKIFNTGAYPRMIENVSRLASGLYFISLSDGSGKILAKGKIAVQH